MGVISIQHRSIKIIPAISAAAYGDGDQIGPDYTKLSGVATEKGGAVSLESCLIIDRGKQKSDLDLYFWSKQPVVQSGDNDAFDVNDADADSLAGLLQVTGSEYEDIADWSCWQGKNLGLLMTSILDGNKDNADGKSLWVTIVSGGTPTYVSTTDLILRFNFVQF